MHTEGPEPRRQGTDPATLMRHFSRADGLLPMWIAEPTLDVAPAITQALAERAADGWLGYETRPDSIIEAFWAWMQRRHDWTGRGLHTTVSPSVGTSIGSLIREMTAPGDGVILQPPVFTDFKSLVSASGRRPVRNSLNLVGDRYELDLEDLAAVAAEPDNTMLIMCSPHNPVGRVWTRPELEAVGQICAENDVFVLADEIHADLALPPNRFTPFAEAASATGVAWAATHGPIKTFGLAGVCDTLMVTDSDEVTERFRTLSSQLHLTRNNVFALTAFETAYRECDDWLDDLLALTAINVDTLAHRLPDQVRVIRPEGTYLAWLDMRDLDLEVAQLPAWLGEAGVALSPGHWFGREGAGFARMTIAASTPDVAQAAERLSAAVSAG